MKRTQHIVGLVYGV